MAGLLTEVWGRSGRKTPSHRDLQALPACCSFGIQPPSPTIWRPPWAGAQQGHHCTPAVQLGTGDGAQSPPLPEGLTPRTVPPEQPGTLAPALLDNQAAAVGPLAA
ncbi:putative Global Transcription Activator Snf2L2 [Manis pentadactyla]|nr:putative Global Transcription Activator Snf2L2 [Manis pentadactyla]